MARDASGDTLAVRARLAREAHGEVVRVHDRLPLCVDTEKLLKLLQPRPVADGVGAQHLVPFGFRSEKVTEQAKVKVLSALLAYVEHLAHLCRGGLRCSRLAHARSDPALDVEAPRTGGPPAPAAGG